MLLIINTQDSFVYNIVEIVRLYRNIDFDVVLPHDLQNIDIDKYNAIMLSPGAGLPSDYPQVQSLLRSVYKEKSIFGVCLGMQFIAELFDLKLVQLAAPKHGHTSYLILQNDSLIFQGYENGSEIGRYHSWVVDRKFTSNDIDIIATDEDDNIMAIEHNKFPIYGVQFHPESIITTNGNLILRNWLDTI